MASRLLQRNAGAAGPGRCSRPDTLLKSNRNATGISAEGRTNAPEMGKPWARGSAVEPQWAEDYTLGKWSRIIQGMESGRVASRGG